MEGSETETYYVNDMVSIICQRGRLSPMANVIEEGITYMDIIERMDVFVTSNYAFYAISVAVKYAIDEGANVPLIFTSINMEENKLSFKCLYKTWRTEEVDYSKGLEVFPHQLYAFFISRGVYVEHVTNKELPKYLGKSYREEDGRDNIDPTRRWVIKSIRNMVFHDCKDFEPSIMLLVDWEIDTNKGKWSEIPDNTSCLSWISFYLLDNYMVLSQYLLHRVGMIRGVTKDLVGIFKAERNDKEEYLRGI